MENSHWKDIYIWFLTNPPPMEDDLLEKTNTALGFRVGPDGERSGQRAADELEISRERVRQILAEAQELYLKAHPVAEKPVSVPEDERIHAFMLQYQKEHGKAASYKTIAMDAGVWKSTTSVRKSVYVLKGRGLVEKRKAGSNVAQWWAIELCSHCEEKREGPRHPIAPSWCAECCEEAFGTQVAFS